MVCSDGVFVFQTPLNKFLCQQELTVRTLGLVNNRYPMREATRGSLRRNRIENQPSAVLIVSMTTGRVGSNDGVPGLSNRRSDLVVTRTIALS